MSRIPPRLIRRAKQHSPNLAQLLPACRDLQSARNELRWLQSHVHQIGHPERLSQLCRQRGRGVPLQHILGSQPFGSLDIKCKPGVLIPRQETEAYACHLVSLLKNRGLISREPSHASRELNIIDFCSGTGCIPLLLFASLQRSIGSLHVQGVDVSSQAVGLANENIARNIKSGQMSRPKQLQSLAVSQGDVFKDCDIQEFASRPWDVMISNPPYISQRVWNHGHGQLGYSVRKYEPVLALVPDRLLPLPSGWVREDIFYARLLDVAIRLKPKIILLEIGDEAQARRVVSCLSQHQIADHARVELWRDWPDLKPSDDEETELDIPTFNGQNWRVPALGSGNIRVICIKTA